VNIGSDALGITIDTTLAAAYNYFFGSTLFPVPAAALDGFYQFNYAQLGVLRKGNWMVTMKGFTDKLFGTEIYSAENRYGRYQSYGALEVLYGGQLAATGYMKNGDGWDWRVAPGTTTVQVDYSALQCANRDGEEEHQLGSFAGALSLGKDGIWGFDFRQDTIAANYTTSNLAFHKSVFAFDTVFICLGSGIKASNSLGNVTTNLFQAAVDYTSTANPSIYINTAATSTAGDYDSTLAAGKYILTAQKTYYYVPTGNDSIYIFRGFQISPKQSDTLGTVTDTARVSKAWLKHGTHPTNAGYQYVMIPNVVKAQLSIITPALAGTGIYSVLKKTDTLHAVKYLPGNVTGYVFFQPAANVNIGYVKSITGKALVGVRENGDTIKVSIASPDLNTAYDSTSYWVSSPASVTLTMSGNWTVASNTSGAVITSNADSLAAGFSLQHGAAATLILVKQNGSRSSAPNSTLITANTIKRSGGEGNRRFIRY
jgi:chondroitin-sulfate-ABC endolyase/exolyase